MYCLPHLFFRAEDGIRDVAVTGVQTCALPISSSSFCCSLLLLLLLLLLLRLVVVDDDDDVVVVLDRKSVV